MDIAQGLDESPGQCCFRLVVWAAMSPHWIEVDAVFALRPTCLLWEESAAAHGFPEGHGDAVGRRSVQMAFVGANSGRYHCSEVVDTLLQGLGCVPQWLSQIVP